MPKVLQIYAFVYIFVVQVGRKTKSTNLQMFFGILVIIVLRFTVTLFSKIREDKKTRCMCGIKGLYKVLHKVVY